MVSELDEPIIVNRWFRWTDLLLMPFAFFPFFFGSLGILTWGTSNSWLLMTLALAMIPLPWKSLCLPLSSGSEFESGPLSFGRGGRRFGVILKTQNGGSHIIVEAYDKPEAEEFALRLNKAWGLARQRP